ncbi:hypothetical protein N7G274_005754 [Stereocaulon virgatum]|uniref:Ubiquitin-like domain-containing protein n=1 Tax=Stereocaulon virgatum TaxID=373712 RepID=A0ABR4AA78_9LECA
MATGFGFSIGDLFLGLKLIKDSIGAVNDLKGAAADYKALVTDITTLQDGLEAIEELQADQLFSPRQVSALRRAVCACQESIQNFLTSISKYQPHLSAKVSGVQSNFRKIKWTLCKKDDVSQFRVQLGRHASAITMLLITFQAKRTMDGQMNENDLDVRVRDIDDACTFDMLKGLTIEQRQFFMIIIQQNKQLLHSIEDVRTLLHTQTAIPPQVLLKQPVILLDPFGKITPFHLDFIDSLECFMAVLKVRFGKAGVTPAGLSKLDNGDFIIQDTQRRRPINLSKNWISVFRPGQNVDMSMVFHRFACLPCTCPACLEINEGDDEQIHCQACGLCYQNVQAISDQSEPWIRHLPGGPDYEASIAGGEIPYVLRQPGKEPEMRVFKPIYEAENDAFHSYRRIQVVSQSLELLDARYPTLQLIRDFCRFAELLKAIPENTSAYIPNIRSLHIQAVKHTLRQRSSFPAFASFSQIEQVRRVLSKESVDLRRSIDMLVQDLCKDEDTRGVMKYIRKTYPSEHGRDYFSAVLTRMISLSDFIKSDSPRVRSVERMPWLLLDSRAQ